ncbi:19294_t:CDS:1, partial [Dentiscutata erythropus]
MDTGEVEKLVKQRLKDEKQGNEIRILQDKISEIKEFRDKLQTLEGHTRDLTSEIKESRNKFQTLEGHTSDLTSEIKEFRNKFQTLEGHT